MEKQAPIRENQIALKQIHGALACSGGAGGSVTLNQTVNNIISAKIAGTVGFLSVFSAADSVQSSSFLYEDTNGVGGSSLFAVVKERRNSSKMHDIEVSGDGRYNMGTTLIVPVVPVRFL